MAIIQTGYLGRVGPVFTIVEVGKIIIVQGEFDNDGKLILKVKAPAYADRLRDAGNFQYTSLFCTLGNYVENQVIPNTLTSYQRPSRYGLMSAYADLSDTTYGPWSNVTVAGASPAPAPLPPATTNPVTVPVGTMPVYQSATPITTTQVVSAANTNSKTGVYIAAAALLAIIILNNQD